MGSCHYSCNCAYESRALYLCSRHLELAIALAQAQTSYMKPLTLAKQTYF